MRMKRELDAIFLQLIIKVVFVAGCVSQSGQDKGTTSETSLKVEHMVTNYEI